MQHILRTDITLPSPIAAVQNHQVTEESSFIYTPFLGCGGVAGERKRVGKGRGGPRGRGGKMGDANDSVPSIVSFTLRTREK